MRPNRTAMRRKMLQCVMAMIVSAPVLAGPTATLHAEEALSVQEIAPGSFVHRGPHEEATKENLGGFANIGFVVGNSSVAVIDSGGSAAHGRRLRAAIRKVTDLPISHVILTHTHPDHIFGTAAFLADDAIVVGHRKLAAAIAARGAFYLEALAPLLGPLVEGTEVVLPTLGVVDVLEIDLGGRVLELTAHPTAHTDNDLTIFDRKTGTLWLGDLLFMERTPAVDGSLKGWLAVLQELRGVPAVRVVPGHGPVSAPWPDAAIPLERYLNRLLVQIRAIIARGGTMEEAIESVGQDERPHWALFETYHPRNIVASFAELEWE